MELRHLRYFVAVAEEENISRAALRLNISQPPLSRQIRDLEEELGVSLFTRTAKSIHLTEPGKVFLKEARSILFRVDVAVSRVQAAAREQREEFNIGYAPSPTSDFLSLILNQFRQTLPKIQIRLHDMTSVEMLEALRKRKIDAGLMVEQEGVTKNGLTFQPLRSYPAGIIVSHNHPSALCKEITVDDLLKLPVMVYSQTEYPDYHAWLRKILGNRSRQLKITAECDGALSLIAAIEASNKAAIAAEPILSVAGSRVVFIPITPAPPPLNVGVCHIAHPLPASSTETFIRVAKQALAKPVKT